MIRETTEQRYGYYKYVEPLSLRDARLMAELNGAKVTARTAAKFNRQRHIVAFVQGVFHRVFR